MVAPGIAPVLFTCSCCWSTFRYLDREILLGTPIQSEKCKRSKAQKPKPEGAMLVAASLVAAIRLRGEEVKPSPKLNCVIYDSILLARTILQLEK